jgi:hypothetical protein
MKFIDQLDARLRAEARALVRVSLGTKDFQYVRTAEALCDFRNGEPRTHLLVPSDPRTIPFLRELQIIRRVEGGWQLNVSVQDMGAPLLMWDWCGK